MARSFSFKRFLFHNKTVICVTVVTITVLLVLQLRASNTRNHYKDRLNTIHRPQAPYSKAELDAYYKLLMGISSYSVTPTINVECENVWTIAAIPGIDIEDYMWEYMSLIAINEVYGENEGRKINSYLSRRSVEDLEKLLESVRFNDLGTVPDKCYRLHEAILVENGNNIYFNPDLEHKSMFLLGEGERRYKEIAQIYGRKQRQYFRLADRYKGVASYEISNFKAEVKAINSEPIAIDDAPIIGMYIRTLELPSSYYERAMDFLRKIHHGSLFYVICPSYLLNECRDRFSGDDAIVNVQQDLLDIELAVMASCDHLVIENEFGILAALLNENFGDVIVYDRMHGDVQWFSKYMTENFENWYSIA